ncbi:MAG: fatty acid desaturase, partial [Methylococcales bacterium]
MSSDVRIQLAEALPSVIQFFLTYVTGYPIPGSKPLWTTTPVQETVGTAVWLLASVFACAWCWTIGDWWIGLVPILWLHTIGAARKSLAQIIHYAIHNRLMGSRLMNRLVGEIFSTILFLQPFDEYQPEHGGSHHGDDFATLKDPDVQLLLMLGFKPGMSRRQLWRQLRRVSLSPLFILKFTKTRLISNFWNARNYRKWMSFIWLLCVSGVVYWFDCWTSFFVAYLIPIIVLYPVSALFQFVSEHQWLCRNDNQSFLDEHKRLSWGRFLADPVPNRNLPLWKRYTAWARWWLRLFFVHLPIRIAVLPGDLSQHDYHHRNPASRDWPIARYARSRDIEQNHHAIPYRDIWGLANAIDTVFEGLSRAKAIT